MLIHTFPPRRMCRVMALRAASICRFVTYACSSAWIPYSPKFTWVPPVALPVRCGRCCFLCLTLRGMSMSSALLARARASGLGGPAPPLRLTRRTLRPLLSRGPQCGRLCLTPGPTGRRLALVDPDLHADPAEGGAGLVEAVVDVRAQRVQRHPALAVELRARHLRAAEAARALHPDALGTGAQRGLHALAHGATERHACRQLLGDALGDQLRVDLGVLDLEDVQLHLLARELLELATDAVGLGAAATDDDAGARRVDVDADAVTRALDLHPRDAGPLHALGHELADRDVLLDVVAVTLTRLGAVGEPPALVLGRDAQAEAVRVDLLTH